MKRSDESVRDLPTPLDSAKRVERIEVGDLDSSFAWLGTVANSTVIGIFLHDFERIVWANPAIE